MLTEIDHVAIAVNDLEAAIDYYERAYGVKVEHREVVERDGVEEALLRVADSYVQLLTPVRDDSTVAKFLERKGEGLHHVGYRVASCAEALDRLKAEGFPVIDEEPRPGSRGTTVAFVHPKGAFGTLIELVEEPSDDLSSVTLNFSASLRNRPCGPLRWTGCQGFVHALRTRRNQNMLVRYDPFRQLDRLNGDLFGNHPSRPRHWMPMDAVQHGNAVELRFDLPGVSPDSVDVTVERQVLTVSAERSWTPAEGDTVITRERPHGSVSRQVTLAETLDTDHLEAHFDAGVLTVTIPVAEQAKARKVEIHTGLAARQRSTREGLQRFHRTRHLQPPRGPTVPFRWGRGASERAPRVGHR